MMQEMKKKIPIIIFGIFFISSCKNTDTNKQTDKKQINQIKSQQIEVSNTNPQQILKNWQTWYNYTYYNIHLAQDFAALDTNAHSINKFLFLERLASGKFIPLQMMTGSGNALPVYKLYNFNEKPDIESTIQQIALHEITNYNMEGKELPNFNFTDLSSLRYNKFTTKGKIIVFKCWFIHCMACVQEFPELNKLVDQYKQDSNIIFVSLALDNKKDLVSFLKDKQFNYAVVPDCEKYISDSLNIQEYPTHILINKNGKIVKVVNSVYDLIPVLRKEVQKENI